MRAVLPGCLCLILGEKGRVWAILVRRAGHCSIRQESSNKGKERRGGDEIPCIVGKSEGVGKREYGKSETLGKGAEQFPEAYAFWGLGV